MLKSADLHETILTQVICHKHVRCHDAVFLREISIGRSKEDEKWIFFIYFSRFPLSEVKKKTKQKNNNCNFVSTYYSVLLSREINLKAQSQYNVRARERLPEKS